MIIEESKRLDDCFHVKTLENGIQHYVGSFALVPAMIGRGKWTAIFHYKNHPRVDLGDFKSMREAKEALQDMLRKAMKDESNNQQRGNHHDQGDSGGAQESGC